MFWKKWEFSKKFIWFQINKLKSRLPDLNQQHLDLQSNALPNWAKAGLGWDRPDLNRSLRLPKPKGSTKLPYGPTYKLYVDDILIIILYLQVYKHYYYFNNSLKKLYNIIILKAPDGNWTRDHEITSLALYQTEPPRQNLILYNTINYVISYLNTLLWNGLCWNPMWNFDVLNCIVN